VAAVRIDQSAQHVDPTLRYLAVEVVGRDDYGKPSSLEFVERLRTQIVPAAGFPEGVAVYAGGGPPGGKDFLDLIYSAFPWLVLGVLAATFVLLVRAFRSLVLPLKAILLNLLSIGAAYGLMVIVFKWGAGEPFGLIAYDQIEGWIPVMLFAVLFGLSMDYEVFLVSRMREAWDDGATNEEAVVLGLTRTGRPSPPPASSCSRRSWASSPGRSSGSSSSGSGSRPRSSSTSRSSAPSSSRAR
jgi:uncharacterized membrane protein YdfJ with MMPL/SSD domain